MPNPEQTIRELSSRHLAETRAPDIVGFVDGLFQVTAATGNLACTLSEEKSLRFSVRDPKTHRFDSAPATTQSQATCTVEHEAARIVLRMICARLGVLCREHGRDDASPYGDRAKIGYELHGRSRWCISYTNSPNRQEFAIEAL